MLLKRPSYKRFDYTPRFYNPNRDPETMRRRELRFERQTRRGKNRPLYWVIAMLILSWLAYMWLSGGMR
jgi:hypothetical protein